ncbi:hypothetical protein I3760_01G034200 [Carya illinoinensis]|uniref:Uncharacterized protein n=1 Tax=Carya illinoinensis TaxID=32201 RepID=A0A922K2L1_CARIL|nr:hypothetical protein I3760_01G034200 [Carya illinoinensis]KAG6729591.1 hypothetical protein I3842_01G036400 [Carya illinoinensis]
MVFKVPFYISSDPRESSLSCGSLYEKSMDSFSKEPLRIAVNLKDMMFRRWVARWTSQSAADGGTREHW